MTVSSWMLQIDYLQLFYHICMAAFWAIFSLVGSGPAFTAHGSLNLTRRIQIGIKDVQKRQRMLCDEGRFFLQDKAIFHFMSLCKLCVGPVSAGGKRVKPVIERSMVQNPDWTVTIF
jgi:hypothetical protein